MSQTLEELFKESQVSEETAKELLESLIDNPMSIMTKVGELGLPPDLLQRAMGLIMSNPDCIGEFVKSLGMPDEKAEEANAKFKAMFPS